MASGVSVADECIQAWSDIKKKDKKKEDQKKEEETPKYRYCIFKLDDENKNIVVDTKGLKNTDLEPEKEYECFLEVLKSSKDPSGTKRGCRWAGYDVEFINKKDNGPRDKFIFMSWCPEDAALKSKMVYAASQGALLAKLVYGMKPLQGTDDDEVSWKCVMEYVGGIY